MRKILIMIMIILPVSAVIGYILAVNDLFPGNEKKTEVTEPQDTSDSATETSESTKASESTAKQETTKNTTQQGNIKMISVKLFFLNSNKNGIVEEIREIRVENGAIMRASVNALIDGPASENFERAFPEETRIIGIRREGELGIVVFSKEFRFENENLEMLAISTVEKTLLQINSIKKVKITVEGK